MRNFLIKLFLTAWVIWFISLVAGCTSQLPAARYAKEHRSREFSSWKEINKRMDKAAKAKPKEHAKRNKN